MFNPNTSEVVRLDRQSRMRAWIVARWGESAMAPGERAERLFEEACELMQAEGRPIERAMKIAAVVYSKPAGNPAQEVAGVQTCALAYCASRDLNADIVERVELERIEGLSIEHFRERHARKIADGLALDVDAEPIADLDRVAQALEAAANVANPSRARTYRNLAEVMRKPGFQGART